jgi:hypothetical protein
MTGHEFSWGDEELVGNYKRVLSRLETSTGITVTVVVGEEDAPERDVEVEGIYELIRVPGTKEAFVVIDGRFFHNLVADIKENDMNDFHAGYTIGTMVGQCATEVAVGIETGTLEGVDWDDIFGENAE